MERIFEVLLDALKDTLTILPLLFLVYVLIEVIENKSAKNLGDYRFLNNKYSPIIASLVGVVPQCGFSVVATDLYSKKHISMGTLLAVYLATSDEAIPIMLSTPSAIPSLLPLLGIKIVYSILVGYAIMFVCSLKKEKKYVTQSEEKTESCDNIVRQEVFVEDVKTLKNSKVISTPFVIEIKETPEEHIGCCGHDIEKDPSTFSKFIMHPLVHVLKICLFIFIVNIVIGGLLAIIGEETLKSVLLTDSAIQPIVFGLVGLIPNCASSVIITELYIEGIASFGSCIAGLCVNAGIALTVLFKQNKNMKDNFLILTLLYILGTGIGMIVNLF